MRKGYEKIIKRINSISKHGSELLQQFSNYLTIQEADAIYHTITLRYYDIKREITKCCRKAPSFSCGDIRQLF
ncbi:hypothetical protein [Faecalibacillus faecis]|uniref:hypothetical protein n=1 Tax=Faecalibacillus faecis TaxID=1982628 RepID=UPI003AB6DCDB